MRRIELPSNNDQMQGIVDRYGPTATIIALNQVRTSRLNGFIEAYVTDDAEPIELPIDGTNQNYTQKMISAVTANGTMVHTRLHETPHQMTDRSIEYLAVIDSFYNEEPVELWTATSQRREVGFSGTSEITIDTTELVARVPGLYVVENDDEVDPDLLMLEQALKRSYMPQIRYGQTGWRYRSELETYETLHDIMDVKRKVDAIRSLLGVVAIQVATSQPDMLLQPTGSDE